MVDRAREPCTSLGLPTSHLPTLLNNKVAAGEMPPTSCSPDFSAASANPWRFPAINGPRPQLGPTPVSLTAARGGSSLNDGRTTCFEGTGNSGPTHLSQKMLVWQSVLGSILTP